MYNDDPNKISDIALSIELLKTIRDIDIRLNEIEIELRSPHRTKGSIIYTNYLIKRICSLLHTRGCCTESFLFVNHGKRQIESGESINPFDNLKIDYSVLDLENKEINRIWQTIITQEIF